MEYTVIRAASRGHLNHGWLDTYHTFSFAEYMNRERMNFGAMRVLNDDYIAPQGVFPFHAHENMEIITIVLTGTIEHEDSLGNKAQIKAGEIQVMSAGTGIRHSEKNPSESEELNLFQIWIYPKQRNITPRYAQKSFLKTENMFNQWVPLVAPEDNPATLTINQDAYIAIIEINQAEKISYHLKNPTKNGVFLMLIEGEVTINNETLYARDAITLIPGDAAISFQAQNNTKLIAVEVPLVFNHN